MNLINRSEYTLAEQNNQSNISKELLSTNSNPKLASGHQTHPSRREERERYQYILNNLNNNDAKRESTNVSIDKGHLLNNSQIANGNTNLPTSMNNITQENVAVSNSLKSSFKSNDNYPTKPESINKQVSSNHYRLNLTRYQLLKKDTLKENTYKTPKFYYLPRNDENTSETRYRPLPDIPSNTAKVNHN